VAFIHRLGGEKESFRHFPKKKRNDWPQSVSSFIGHNQLNEVWMQMRLEVKQYLRQNKIIFRDKKAASSSG
jgi:hypothetical protein